MKKFMIVGLMMALVACSSKGGDKAPPTDTTPRVDDPTTPVDESQTPGNVDGGSPNPGGPDSGPKAPTNQAECVAVCESKYPKSAAQNKTFDNTCMLAGVCEKDCNDLVPGKNYQPTVDPDAGETCDTVKANSFPISTPGQACSDCIAATPTCCSLWIAIFSSEDGKSLNACANACFSQFKN